METQIKCPNCGTPFGAEIDQVIDVGQEPEKKARLIQGTFNLAQCPACKAVTQIASPILYHDPENELFMVHIPIELGVTHSEQERLIGQLVQRAMDQLPPEQRKGYMLQPQVMLNLQSLVEKVLETEGITPEMLERQRKQSELLDRMMSSGKAELDQLIEDNDEEIDETFYALLQAIQNAAEQSGQEEISLKLVNIQARLFRQSTFGKKMEKRQQALHNFQREARKAGGVSPRLLLQHVLANREDEAVLNALVLNAGPAFNYEFFVNLSERIDKREQAGKDAKDLIELRERLLEMRQTLENESKAIVDKASKLISTLLNSEDMATAIRDNIDQIDDAFMMVLESVIAQSSSSNQKRQLEQLNHLKSMILDEAENQAPPELRLINRLIRAENPGRREELLGENTDVVNGRFLELVRAIKKESIGSGGQELERRIAEIEKLVETHLQANEARSGT